MRTILLLLCFLLLCGCSVPEGSVETEKAATEPVRAVEIAVDPFQKTPPYYPFGSPEDLKTPSYDDYFSEYISYNSRTDRIDMSGWKWNNDDGKYWIYYNEKDGTLVISGDYYKDKYIIATQEEYPDCKWLMGDGYWVYGIQDGKRLFRIDYHGNQYEVLFEDADYRLDLMEEDHIMIYNHVDLCFQVEKENAVYFCRIFLPEKRFEVVYETGMFEYPFFLRAGAKSNYEIHWGRANPDFDALYRAALKDPDSPIYDYPDNSEVANRFARECEVPRSYLFYYNSKTNEYYELEVFGDSAESDGYYLRRTEENIQKNGHDWWKDFQ